MNSENFKDDELQDAPILKNMSRENPFTVPQGYFDSFPTLMSEKIASHSSKPAWSVFFQKVFRPRFVVTACVLAVAITSGVIYFNRDIPVNNPEIIISYNDLKNSDYLDQMDESDLVEAYSSSEQELSQDNSKNSSIENYLIDNQTDISLIENAL